MVLGSFIDSISLLIIGFVLITAYNNNWNDVRKDKVWSEVTRWTGFAMIVVGLALLMMKFQ